MSNIITITTDFGLQDYFVGVMKGVMLSINPDAKLVDLNNNVKRHDIVNGYFSLRNSFNYFPKGTVHLVVVDPGVGSKRRPVAISYGGYFFVGPDNGIFSMLYKGAFPFEIREITNSSFMLDRVSTTFHGRDIFSPAAAYISLEQSIENVGGIIDDPVTIDVPVPEIKDNKIKGDIVYEDVFGNLITNISTEILSKNDDVLISGKRLKGIHSSYSEVKKGEPVAVTGSSGYLEVAVNSGRASAMFPVTDGKIEVIKEGNKS